MISVASARGVTGSRCPWRPQQEKSATRAVSSVKAPTIPLGAGSYQWYPGAHRFHGETARTDRHRGEGENLCQVVAMSPATARRDSRVGRSLRTPVVPTRPSRMPLPATITCIPLTCLAICGTAADERACNFRLTAAKQIGQQYHRRRHPSPPTLPPGSATAPAVSLPAEGAGSRSAPRSP